MIFLNAKITALIFSLFCLVASIVSGIFQGIDIQVLLMRALTLALLGMLIGFAFGYVIKELFLETIEKAIIEDEKIKEKEAVIKQQEEQINREKYLKNLSD